MAVAAVGLVAAQMARAISTSLVCRRGLRLPMWFTFRFWIGSITAGAISLISSGMPPSAFSAFSSAAEDAPSSAEVLPVTTLPSGSSMAAAGSPVASATRCAGSTVLRISGLMPSECISSSCFWSSPGSALPSRSSRAVL